MAHEYFGTDGVVDRSAASADIPALVEQALRPVADAVGLDAAALAIAVDRDLSRRVARAVFDEIASLGIPVEGQRVLDMGAGLGQTSVEAIARRAHPVAIEPGLDWCRVVATRMQDAGDPTALAADGERLPFRDASFDLVLSIAVLEHVRRPENYLREAWRVLRPGGHLYLTCENYLGFWEPHYQLRWLPLFPKPLASLYLSARGRPTGFLRHSITYTTRPWVNRRLRSLGFHPLRESRLEQRLQRVRSGEDRSSGVLRLATRIATPAALARGIVAVENARLLFTTHYVTVVRKPAAS